MKYVLLIAMMLMVGCTDRTPGPAITKKATDQTYALIVYEDETHGVTCYRVEAHEGLSCLKTKLSAKEQLEENQIKAIFGEGESK